MSRSRKKKKIAKAAKAGSVRDQIKKSTAVQQPPAAGRLDAAPGPVPAPAPERPQPIQWRQVVEEMAAAEKRAAAARSAPAEPTKPAKAVKPAKPVKAEGKAHTGALLARARETAGPAVRSALSAAQAAWEKASSLTSGGWDRAGRTAVKVRRAVARHPVSPLLYATVLAVAIGVASFQGM